MNVVIDLGPLKIVNVIIIFIIESILNAVLTKGEKAEFLIAKIALIAY
jgi:hypothetical protein